MPRRALSPGTRLGRYTIERRLGSNVLAEFYLARHEITPEQTRGVEASPASDVYAAGVVLFEMLAGVTPHRTLTLAELLLRIATQEAPSVKTLAAHVPDAVADALASFLHLDPSARPQDAGAAREVLERALASPPRG